VRYIVKAKEIYFKTKYRPVGMFIKCFRYMVSINLNCIVHPSMVKHGYIPEKEV